MALQTKYINAGTDSAEWKCRLIVTENSTDIDSNTSSLTLTLQFTRSRSGGYSAWCGYSTSATLAVGGTSKTVTVNSFNYSSVGVDDWKTLCSATFEGVYHLDDGTINAAVAGYWHQTYCSPNTCNVSGSIALTTIPRKATVGTSGASRNPGDTVTISIGRKTDKFKNTLSYKVGNMTSYTTIASNLNQNSYDWTIPTSIYSTYPNAAQATLYIKCETFNGSTSIGTDSCSFVVKTDNVKPAISSCVVTDTNTAVTNKITDGTFVKGISNAKITVSASASTGASIKSYTYAWGSNSITNTNSNYTISGINSNKITITVTDSRGKTVSVTKTITLANYFKPSIISASLDRTSSLSDTVTTILNAKWYHSKIGNLNNTLKIQYRFKKEADAGFNDWANLDTLSSSSTSSDTYAKSFSLAFNHNYNYTVDFRISDVFNTNSITKQVAKGLPIIDIGKNDIRINGDISGDKITGSTSISSPSFIKNGVEMMNTQITHEYTSGQWDCRSTYVKYDDGSCVLYLERKIELNSDNIKSLVGGWYFTTLTFDRPKDCDMTSGWGGTASMMGSCTCICQFANFGYSSTDKKYQISARLILPNDNASNFNGNYICFVIFGAWKAIT